MGDNQSDMKSKKQSGKKVLDVTRPKKRTAVTDAPSAPQLVIPKRSIIVPVSGPEPPAGEPIKAKQVAEKVQPVNVSDPVEPETEQAPKTPDMPQEEYTAPETQPGSRKPEKDDTTPDTPQGPDVDDTTKEADDGPKPPKAGSNVRKALEDAKREQELQGYIANRDFFVPINAVARKRSLKVSMSLVFVELLLGLFLLNLMLDAGVIQLLEKIPHTSFFDL
jgi:hypothetical protein